MGKVVFFFILGLIFAIFLKSRMYMRHYEENGKLRKALFIALPGYEESVSPENIVELSNWKGTQYKDLVAKDEVTGEINLEATAGLALKMMPLSLWPDHELKRKPDGHYILYKLPTRTRYFTWWAYRRISPGKKAKF